VAPETEIKMRCVEQAVILCTRQHDTSVERVAEIATQLYSFVSGQACPEKSGRAGKKDKQSILD
jgi:hypothetical protein